MGVTTGGLQPNEYQIITITIPNAPANVTKLTEDLQKIIDAFQNNIEILS